MPFLKPDNRRTLKRRLRRCVGFEPLETRRLLAGLPYGAHPNDTGEFMLGSIVVTPVFLESNGSVDNSVENWNPAHIQDTLARIREGMDWWVESLDQLSTVHELSFVIDTTFANAPASTAYEPINRRSNDYVLYVNEFLQNQGYASGNIETEIRSFNHAQRQRFDTDWAFTIFVANSEFQNSQDQQGGMFAAGGSFRRAFAFAGGLFMVVPSTRPASTFTHETGHMFWARDEYAGGGTYFANRGYYNSRNENAWDNPTPGFVQQPSIMASGTLLETAYQNHTSASATFAQLGWKDSDSDGIFDVLDVPFELIGSGYWDVAEGVYRFAGTAEVQTLRNQNSSGLQNDITLNVIREIEYRFDGGAWQVFSQPNVSLAELDLAIPASSGASTIEIRARDSHTTVTSNVFTGRLSRADATSVPGINGFMWIDQNNNGLRDVGELGSAGWTVSLVNSSGEELQLRKSIEPDTFPVGPLGSSPVAGVVFVSIGGDTDGRVGISSDSSASTGGQVFSAYSVSTQAFVNTWTSSSRRLQASFVTPTSTVSIDAIGADSASYGRLEAYNSSGQLIDRVTTGVLQAGQTETMTISRGTNDIAYIIVAGASRSSIKLDNLQFGPQSSVQTGSLGQYSFSSLTAGQYNVKFTPPNGFIAFAPASGQSSVTVVANTAVQDVDFGFRVNSNPWHNPVDRFDVSNDNRVSALDALQIINVLNSLGSRILAGSGLSAPPFVDVNNDGRVSAIDALQVINLLNSRSGGGGEGETGSDSDGGGGEGETGSDSDGGGGFASSASSSSSGSSAGSLPDSGGSFSSAPASNSGTTSKSNTLLNFGSPSKFSGLTNSGRLSSLGFLGSSQPNGMGEGEMYPIELSFVSTSSDHSEAIAEPTQSIKRRLSLLDESTENDATLDEDLLQLLATDLVHTCRI